ncbi:hypothetical protein ABPG72_011810 [Tetrahymena utriculariae]
MQSVKHLNQSNPYIQKAPGNNKSSTILPALEQSTRITNSNSIKGIEKRIPKSVLHELQNTQNMTLLSYHDSNFFITQFGDNRQKGSIRKTVSQIESIKVQKPKQKIEVIMGELGQAIKRLKNLKQVQPPKNKIKSSESSLDEKEKADDLFMNQVEKTLQDRKNQNSIDTYDLKSQSVSRIFFKNRAEQVDVMQENLTDGLNKFNKVMENVKERERKLFELQTQLNKIHNEEDRVKFMKGQDSGSAGSLQQEIDYFQDKMNELQMERNILKNMKSVRKKDLEVIKVPYYKDRDVLVDLNQFLEKETENLVNDAKQIDQIRTSLIEQEQFKKQLEAKSIILVRDQEIHKKNEENLEKVIEQEIEYSKFQQELKIQERKEREKELQEKRKKVYLEQQELRAKLDSLKIQFQQIASNLPALENPRDVINNFEEIKETNFYLKKKQESQIQIMKDTRIEIQNMQKLLKQLKNEKCTVQKEDKLQVEMDETTQDKLEKQINEQIFQQIKAKQDQQRSVRLLTDIKKGLSGIVEQFQYSQLQKISKTNLQSLTIEDMSAQVQYMFEILFDQFSNLDVNEQEIQTKLQQKRTQIAKRITTAISEKNQNNFSEKELLDDEQSDSLN